MNTLEFICPFCMGERQEKIHLSCKYEDDALTIPWECTHCNFKGEWKREIRKPSLFVRVIQAIKRAWN